MSTPFSNIYTKFLKMIKDIVLANKFISNPDIAEDDLYNFLDNACVNFPRCKKNLDDRDLILKQFNGDLSSYEILILARLMLVEWMQPYVTDITNVQMYLPDNEFKMFSQANFLDSKVALQQYLEDQAENLKRKYSYDTLTEQDFMALGRGY